MIDWIYWLRIVLVAAAIFDTALIVTAGIGLERSVCQEQTYVLAEEDTDFWCRVLAWAFLAAVALMVVWFATL